MNNTKDILLIEDNIGDIRLMQEAMKECELNASLSIVQDGEEALNFLFKKGVYQDSPRPSLIILNLNLPKKDGKEVLETIKQDESLKTIPVVILTATNSVREVNEMYNLNANCFVEKAYNLQEQMSLVKNLKYFWLSRASLPTRN